MNSNDSCFLCQPFNLLIKPRETWAVPRLSRSKSPFFPEAWPMCPLPRCAHTWQGISSTVVSICQYAQAQERGHLHEPTPVLTHSNYEIKIAHISGAQLRIGVFPWQRLPILKRVLTWFLAKWLVVRCFALIFSTSDAQTCIPSHTSPLTLLAHVYEIRIGSEAPESPSLCLPRSEWVCSVGSRVPLCSAQLLFQDWWWCRGGHQEEGFISQ